MKSRVTSLLLVIAILSASDFFSGFSLIISNLRNALFYSANGYRLDLSSTDI